MLFFTFFTRGSVRRKYDPYSYRLKGSVVEQPVYGEEAMLPTIYGPLVSAFVRGVLGSCLVNTQIPRLRGDQGLMHEDQSVLSIDVSMEALQG